jgi:hypothetical protein
VFAGAGVGGSISAFRSGFVFTVAVSSSRPRRSGRQVPLGAGSGYVGLSGFSIRNRWWAQNIWLQEFIAGLSYFRSTDLHSQNVSSRISRPWAFADNVFVEPWQSCWQVGNSYWRLENVCSRKVTLKLTSEEGASGLGKAYAQVFAKAGWAFVVTCAINVNSRLTTEWSAYVTIGDFNEKAGKETVAEIAG